MDKPLSFNDREESGTRIGHREPSDFAASTWDGHEKGLTMKRSCMRRDVEGERRGSRLPAGMRCDRRSYLCAVEPLYRATRRENRWEEVCNSSRRDRVQKMLEIMYPFQGFDSVEETIDIDYRIKRETRAMNEISFQS
jgi:hypothetical protein